MKTTVVYRLTLLEWLLPIRQVTIKHWRGCGEKKKTSFTAGGGINWYSHSTKQYGGSSET